MKKNFILFIGLVVLMSVSFVSCGDPNAPQKPNKQNNSMSYKEKWLKIVEYLSDNYEVGDSVVFKSESNVLDTFVVTNSNGNGLITPHEIGGELSEFQEKEHGFTYDTVAIASNLEIVGAKYKMRVSLGEKKEFVGGCTLYQVAMTGQAYGSKDIVGYDIVKMPDDCMIETTYGSCHLRRGEGVIDFSDTEGHTWTLVEKLKIQY